MSKQELCGVVLAAGKGSRMFPFSTRFPKPLLPVCNRPLMEYQIATLADMGIRDIYIVIGHYGFEIVKALGMGERYGVRFHYVEQGEAKGIAHAVGQLEPQIEKPFMLFLGDIYFETTDLGKMARIFEQEKINAVLATKQEDDPAAIRRNFAVIENAQGFVRRVIEKPRHIENALKGCGLYLFDLHIFDAIRRTPRTAMRDEYEITDSIQILIDDGYKVKSLQVVEEDINLTYPSDLLMLNLRALRASGQTVCLGQNVSLARGVEVENAVIGDNVVIERPIRIKNSVIFPNVTFPANKDIVQAIVTENQVISCSAMTDVESDT